jgi:hypothetical protein
MRALACVDVAASSARRRMLRSRLVNLRTIAIRTRTAGRSRAMASSGAPESVVSVTELHATRWLRCAPQLAARSSAAEHCF